MLTTTQVLLVSLIALHEYGILSASVAGSDSDVDYYKLMYGIGKEKRGYVYDKEKRPRYDFGIGKRSMDSNRQKMYAFGLGKRNPLDYDVFEFTPYDAKSDNDMKDKPEDQYFHDTKGKSRYDFGMNKRQAQKMYAFGLGKRNAYNSVDYDTNDFLPFEASRIDDDFKDRPEEFQSDQSYFHDTKGKNHYDFAMNKRQAQKLYSFGLGKRNTFKPNDYELIEYEPLFSDKDDKRSPHYSFGLGKRDALNDYEMGDNELRDDYTKRLQPYGFGLGKRAAPAPYSFGLGKRYVNEYGISQRSQRYNFGLGKRSAYDSDGKRSRYNFGLGKRDASAEEFSDLMPYNRHDLYTRASQKFNFGLGKREVSNSNLQQMEDEIPPTLTAMSDLRNAFDGPSSLSLTAGLTKNREAVENSKQQEMSIKH